MADKQIKFSGKVTAADFKYVKYVGKTKGGKTVTIEMPKAICLSNPDWSFAEKDDVVATIEFTGCYTDTDVTEVPVTVTYEDGTVAGNDEILTGVGKFYVGTSASDAQFVGLTRGGGSLVINNEFRRINADGDRGAYVDRVALESAEPVLTLNALQWLTKVADLYTGVSVN